jgi:hypothetical protein
MRLGRQENAVNCARYFEKELPIPSPIRFAVLGLMVASAGHLQLLHSAAIRD